jgi:hypothetical protein
MPIAPAGSAQTAQGGYENIVQSMFSHSYSAIPFLTILTNDSVRNREIVWSKKCVYNLIFIYNIYIIY